MPLLQLQPHPFASLPEHPALPPEQTRPSVQEFIRSALHEARELLDSVPSAFIEDPKMRPSPPSASKVRLLRRLHRPKQLADGAKSKPEFWVCRKSEHTDANTKGTASWSEFKAGLRYNHAEHEMEYTPSITGVKRLLQWDSEAIEEVDVNGIKFNNMLVEINLITHTFHPRALISPRSFNSLTVSADYQPLQGQPGDLSPTGFVTVQIPFYPDASSTPTDLYQLINANVPRRNIFANYASVEQVTLLPAPSSQSPSEPRRIVWTMATTSDAGGSIPQWVQRNWTLGGVPRAIVADVGLFIGWTMRQRRPTCSSRTSANPPEEVEA